jgi:ATP-dependent helicase HrpA
LFASVRATFVDSIEDAAQDIRTRMQFDRQLSQQKSMLSQQASALTKAIDESLVLVAEIRKLCDERYVRGWEHIGTDIDEQLRHLFKPLFLRATTSAQLAHYPRYLKAIVMRLNKARRGAMERDLETFKQIRPLWQNYLSIGNSLDPAVDDYRWAIEELRVGLFAQELRTPMPVSVKRVTKMWDELSKTIY